MNNQHEREKDPLKKPEQFHRFMFEDNPQPMWVYDLETLKFLKVNKAAVAVYGYTEKEFMTMTLKDIRPAEDVPKLLRNIESTINTYNQAGVWQHNKKNGDTLIVEIHSHYVLFNNRPSRHVMVRDITAQKKAETKLQQTEEKLKFFAEHARDIIYRVSIIPDRKFEYVSPAATAMTGFTPEEHYADPDLGFKMVHPDDRTILQELMASGEGFEKPIQLRWVRKDGGNIWTEQINVPIYDKQGVLIAIEGIARDISERKFAEEKLFESRELFRAIASSTPDHIIIQDCELRYVYVANPQLNMKVEEMIGKTDFDLLEYKEAEQLTTIKMQVMHSGIPVNLEAVLHPKTGNPEYFEGTYVPRIDNQGKTSGVIGYFRNVTERKRAKDNLKESEEKYRTLIENMGEGILMTDLDDRILYTNQRISEIYGYSPDELTGKIGYEILEHTDFHDVLKSKKEKRLQGQPDTFEVKGIKKSGETIWVRINGAPVRNAGGEIIGSVGIVSDITGQKQAGERMLQLINRLLESEETMKSKAAHQLHDHVGQNLTALTINLNYMAMQLSKDSKTKVQNRLDDSLAILSQTIEQIRDIMSDLRPSVLDDYGLHAALNWSADLFARRTGIRTIYRGKNPSKPLSASLEHTLFRVSQEVLHNVAKHSKASLVEITMDESDESIYLTIKDDGIGFDHDEIYNSGTRHGWGLLSMEERIRLIGGNIEIISKPGQGTEIRIKSNK